MILVTSHQADTVKLRTIYLGEKPLRDCKSSYTYMPDFLLGSIFIPSKFPLKEALTKVMFSLKSNEVKPTNLNDVSLWGKTL